MSPFSQHYFIKPLFRFECFRSLSICRLETLKVMHNSLLVIRRTNESRRPEIVTYPLSDVNLPYGVPQTCHLVWQSDSLNPSSVLLRSTLSLDSETFVFGCCKSPGQREFFIDDDSLQPMDICENIHCLNWLVKGATRCQSLHRAKRRLLHYTVTFLGFTSCRICVLVKNT